MKFDKDHAVMGDGGSYYAFGSRLGIDDELCVTYGADGCLGDFDYDAGKAIFPKQHRKEISEYMIALWKRWAETE